MNDFLRKVHGIMGLVIWAVISIVGVFVFGYGDKAALASAAGFISGLAYAQLAPWGVYDPPSEPSPEPWPGEDDNRDQGITIGGPLAWQDPIWDWEDEPEEE